MNLYLQTAIISKDASLDELREALITLCDTTQEGKPYGKFDSYFEAYSKKDLETVIRCVPYMVYADNGNFNEFEIAIEETDTHFFAAVSAVEC